MAKGYWIGRVDVDPFLGDFVVLGECGLSHSEALVSFRRVLPWHPIPVSGRWLCRRSHRLGGRLFSTVTPHGSGTGLGWGRTG